MENAVDFDTLGCILPNYFRFARVCMGVCVNGGYYKRSRHWLQILWIIRVEK